MTLELYDQYWKTLDGPNGKRYDVSVPLDQLMYSRDPAKTAKIYEELWANLVYKDMVSEASCLALPQLVKISRHNSTFDADFLKLCATIILRKYWSDKPVDVPYEYEDYYNGGIKNLQEYIIEKLGREVKLTRWEYEQQLEESVFRYALSILACCKQEFRLGMAILKLDIMTQVDFFDNYYKG